MQMTEIRREQIGASSIGMESALAELAASAKELLGYEVLAQRVKTAVVEDDSPLRMALRELDIEVLSERDVVTYQKERLIERTTEKMREWMETIVKAAFGECAEDGYNQFSGPNWVRVPIREYRQPIPEYVLAKAVRIKERMPECELIVESLEDHPDPFLIVGPQKARYSWKKPEEHYYVEVWAEPKFEGRLGVDESDIPF